MSNFRIKPIKKSVRKTTVGKRILLSWIVCAVIFSLIGFGIGRLTGCSEEARSVSESHVQDWRM